MNDRSAILKASVLGALRSRLRGTLLVRGDEGYDIARRVWNGAIDRHPSCIVGCADAEDVSHAMRIAADHGLRMTVRGGGHNVARWRLTANRAWRQFRGATWTAQPRSPMPALMPATTRRLAASAPNRRTKRHRDSAPPESGRRTRRTGFCPCPRCREPSANGRPSAVHVGNS